MLAAHSVNSKCANTATFVAAGRTPASHLNNKGCKTIPVTAIP